MSATRITTALGSVVLATAILASTAGAEPKNQWPFTRPLDNRILAQAVTSGASLTMPVGESKNEAPFTARVSADPGMAAALRTISRYYAGERSSLRAAPEARSSGAFGGGTALVLGLVAAGLGGLALLVRRGGFVKVS